MTDKRGLRPLPGKFSSVAADAYLEANGGEMWLFRPARGVVLLQVNKRVAAEHAPFMVTAFQRALVQGGSLSVFYDLETAAGYDSEARSAITRWLLDNRANARAHHFLVTSRIVSMGISTASLVLDPAGVKLTNHAARPAFDSALLAGAV